MSKVMRAFSRGKAFIPFVTAGDPSLEKTEELICAMAGAGADLIEIGIPFSDPVAEGIVIQQADERALKNGVTTEKIFDMAGRVRRRTDVPLAFMTYFNPVFVYGAEKFTRRAAQCGVDALIVPDLPFEEKGELQPSCSANGVDLISLVAPTSRERISVIAAEAQGFVYCVSSLGVTGVRDRFSPELRKMVSLVRSAGHIPCAVGFGVSTPEQAADISSFADGVIVGSAVVRIVAKYGGNCVAPVAEYVRTMKAALK